MSDHTKEKRKSILLWGFFFLLFLILNFATRIGGQTDDMYYYTMGMDPNFTYINWIRDMWTGWSSRLIINCLCVFFNVAPHLVWRIANTFSLALIPVLLWKISDASLERNRDAAYLSCLLFLLVPYVVLGEAGWIVTTVNYAMPAAALLACLCLLRKISRSAQIKTWEWALYFISACIATDAEQSCIFMLTVYTVFFGWMLIQKKKEGRTGVALLTGFAWIRAAMILICPGNAIRKSLIIAENYPAFGEFRLSDKLMTGIFAVGSDMFLIFFAVTFTMTLLLAITVWKRCQTWYKRLTAAVPLTASLVFPGLVCLMVWQDHSANALTGGGWFASLKNVLVSLGILEMQNQIWDRLPLLFYALVVLIFLCLFLSLYWAFENSETGIVTACALCLGCCMKGAIAFSGSIWLSHARTGIYMALAEIFVILQLYRQWKQTEPAQTTRKFLFILTPFAFINLLVSFACAILYVR